MDEFLLRFQLFRVFTLNNRLLLIKNILFSCFVDGNFSILGSGIQFDCVK